MRQDKCRQSREGVSASGSSSALVMGSSIVQHLVVPKSKTFCYPGACVQDINIAALQLLYQPTGRLTSTVLTRVVITHPADFY